MATKTIVIDGYIGPYGYSKQFVRNELTGHAGNPVVVKISSLGGSVDDAISIHDQFTEHGHVTAELSAFVASSATLLSLGAKTVRMNENSFYLIHKAMNWVDQWGSMNEDQIEVLIMKLEAQKQQLAKVTLQLAKMYVKKSGKSLEQIIDLMKKETWLTADEAREWGFVDEVFTPDVAVNFLDNLQMVAMITSNGFPDPPRMSIKKTPSPTVGELAGPEDSFFDRFWNRFVSKQREVTPNNPIIMKKQFLNLNNLLGVEALESSGEGVFLNEQQLQLIENRVEANQQLVIERDNAVRERETAVNNLTTAQANLTTAQANLTASQATLNAAYDPFNLIDPAIATAETSEAKASAIRALLAARPATAPVQTLGEQDDITTDEVDWEAINNLPHNKLVDKNS
jgi:ATP-dependent protease ClpP protease subunit